MMELDVLVIGSGIAGCCAAIEAGRAGARVGVACAGPLFSGSSFYPGTWGLGLVAPLDEVDEADLVDTVCAVGCGVADRPLVSSFVRGIRPGVAWLERDLGVVLKRPASAASAREAAFIPCFDHRHRAWRGLVRERMERAFAAELDRLGVRVLEGCELMDLATDGAGAIAGAVLYDAGLERMRRARCGAVVLAAGGTGGLFERSLTSGDVLSSAHGIALAHGCRLVNIEFMQMMPGLVAPVGGVVFNEKSFRFAATEPALPRELLEQRSTYGPFTCRLASRAVDLAIDAAGPQGMPLRYRFPDRDVPEFVREFCSWLEREHGIGAEDELRVALYAHAANGGIRIDAQGGTGVPGLYACGEITGGMHGADRIGGLSSANGLVFGRRAGAAAAAWARTRRRTATAGACGDPAMRARAGLSEEDAADLIRELRRTMGAACMVRRTEEGLAGALAAIDAMRGELAARGVDASAASDADRARAARLRSQLALARAMASAMLARRESLGSHYRADAATR